QITDEGEWPFVDLGKSEDLKPGQWCIACGHPGGYKKDRPPVVRLGRVLETSRSVIVTDCTLGGGDSGGPLFDLDGKVIGIHSRIGGPITANAHVPVDTYRSTWDRLVKSEVWRGAWLGVHGDYDTKDCVVADVVASSPADKAGLKAEDVILRFDGQAV